MGADPLDHRHAIGIHRRELLQVGFSGLFGIGLPSLFAGPALAGKASKGEAGARKPKSVIIVFLTGAPSHLDMFDMKPDAPEEIRGEFKPTATRIPGLHICEHLPRLAQRTDKLAVVRSMSHRENNHLVATHQVLTGHAQPGAFFDKVASRDDWPCYSSTLNHVRPRSNGIPAGVNLPTFLMEGPLVWPGQHAGFLGPKNDPWQITRDPNAKDFRVENLRPAPGIAVERMKDRSALLATVDRQQGRLADLASTKPLSDQQKLAFAMLTSDRVARAFEMDREPPAVRDRYGRHAFGQSLLLARRLVEAGVPVVQANMGHVQNWDTHENNFKRMKNDLMPPLDRGVASLLDDLEASGLLDETFVIMLGEFGRTPRVGKGINGGAGAGKAGRDHWANCFFAVFAGGGVKPGQVIGKSDKIGAFPLTTPYSYEDLGATVYHVLGIDPALELTDREKRPVQLNRGEVMHSLFTA
ncbi:MAG TPA: DUF1501 domain-containing protein [Gemmataceae bacterium]|jgi:hypothetical protein|nr:DUF1501 domain-containing protein [Gemmataceae bacterium]